MDEHVSKNIKLLLDEMNTIKEALSPLLTEIKKVKSFEAELRRLRAETDAKIKKIEFENRRLSHMHPEQGLRHISELRAKIEVLSSEIHRLKGMQTDEKKLNSTVEKIKNEVYKNLPNEESFSQKELQRVKKLIDEIDNKYRTLISSTTAKTAALIPGFDNLNRQLIKTEEFVKELSKKIEEKNEKTSKHFEQVIDEINLHKKEIHSDKSSIARIEKRLADVNSILDKVEKQSSNSVGEIKSRIYRIEKRVLSTNSVDKAQTSLEGALTKDTLELRKKITELEGKLANLNSALNGISIKVENNSRILGDMEKVL